MEFFLKQLRTGTGVPGLQTGEMLVPVGKLLSGWAGGPIDFCCDVFCDWIFFLFQHLDDVIGIFEMSG